MAATEAYTTINAVKRDLNTAGANLDASVEAALAAATSEVEQFTHRRFDRQNGIQRTFTVPPSGPIVPARRRFQASVRAQRLRVGDMAAMPTAVSVRADGDMAWTALAADDWTVPVPRNPDRPLSQIIRLGDVWPVGNGPTVRVTGSWGWASVPPSVELATRLLAVRYTLRFRDPIMSENQAGSLLLFDPDVATLLKPFKQVGVAL